MNLSLSDKVKDLRATIEKNKLVIFVGSGVSRNSGIPTWSGLIQEFAKKIKYDKCKTCTHKMKGCKLQNCQDRYSFTQDEFLKIPQYFYNNDKSKGHKRYQRLIVDTLKSDNKSNPLNNMIMTLLPKHIITTNYDKLLENSKNPNTMLYDIIIEDKDLLTHNSNNYIIKMHGDIDKPDTIILKEDDYINYPQEHILIETYIKSLLIDHTFLFIGYSLADYNLKLALGWIQYLAKEHSVNGKRPNNYIIQVEDTPVQEHIEKYFESNNIFILNTYDLPAKIKEKYYDVDLPNRGKEVYAVLNYIYDDKNDYLLDPLSEILYEKYRVFDAFKRISFEDLLSVYSFGRTEKKGGNLYFHQPDEFRNLKLIIESTEKKETYIKQVLLKAGIFGIQCREECVTFKEENNTKQTINDELFELYLNNEYLRIFSRLNNIKDDNLIFYYYQLILPYAGKLNIKLNEIENNVRFKHKLCFIFYKYNRILFKQLTFQSTTEDYKEFENIILNMPKQYKKYYGFIEKLLNDMSKNRLKCLNLLSEHEIQYLRTNNCITLRKRLGNLPDLQALAYDYYYYFKFNNIMLDYLSNSKTYFEPYIRAVLCTFSPQKDRPLNDERGFELYIEENYRLNSIDFDMLIKFTKNKSLKSWVSDYKVKEITFEDDVNIVEKFVNLCASMKIFRHTYNNVHLSNYLFIITKCNFTNVDKVKIITALGKLIQQDENKVNDILVNFFEDIEYIINFYRDEMIISFDNILYTLLQDDTIKQINERFEMNLSIVFRNLLKYSDAHVHNVIDNLIGSQPTTSEKLNMIYTLRYLFSDAQKFNYMRIVKENTNLIHSQYLYKYIVDKNLTFDETIKGRFIDIIEKEVEAKKANPGVCNYPNWLTTTLDYCINLHLLKIWGNIDCLRPFAIYSDRLSFILDSENFDYTKIDMSNYMWTNLFRNKDYHDILKSHKSDIITSDFKKAVENGYATDDQKKILYKYLLSEDELWNV